MNGHIASSNGHVAASLPPTFVRLALLVRPWWRGVALNLMAGLLNQGSGIALAVVSALLVARVATGMRANELLPYLAVLAGLTIATAIPTSQRAVITGWPPGVTALSTVDLSTVSGGFAVSNEAYPPE